ncbi:Zinc finger [Lecanosticta acicola]|uniref:Zinc finger n=1 Tax=Lecanosticta acicola TaxID=111012 RepID=A0AAI8YZ80_9PEZI|nr:Zinc finger [Lecanosticta acicola]
MEHDERDGESQPPLKRHRASRACQAKCFECHQPGCGKRYSRAEHLHRHELNHNPKKVYTCEFPDCGHTFVRPDLFARHKARHEEQPIASTPADAAKTASDVDSGVEQPVQHQNNLTSPAYTAPVPNPNQKPHAEPGNTVTDWAVPPPETLLTPGTSTMSAGPSLSIPLDGSEAQSSASDGHHWVAANTFSTQTNDNFANWLFESPGSQYSEFNLTNLPFLDFGLDYSPKDLWNFDDHGSNSDPHGSGSHPVTPNIAPGVVNTHPYDKRVSEQLKAQIVTLLAQFCRKEHEKSAAWRQVPDHLLFSPDGQHFPNLNADVLDNLLATYWLSKQMPIIHEPTFSTKSANILLVLTMVAMGAYDLVRSRPKGDLEQYKELSLMIMTHLRWEIFTDKDAQPPVQLWVAQSLLLLEYYEKQCSTRKLHERAHIHHASTLTLLRRGSPLVGRSDSESPVSGTPTRATTPVRHQPDRKPDSADSWWIQWVRNESFNRVVFTALQMDTLHAVIYGHAADMAPYEIRLTLPCDDSLWDAKSADEVQKLDANLKMYGIKPLNFLDGLKRCLHAHEVQTHAPARMILMAGLLSVGWHISRREKHLQFLETVPSIREQARWRTLLLNAFGYWRTSFDEAVGSRQSSLMASKQQEMNIAKSAVLFHLAHMTLHADIIDCQIFAGTKRLLGRRVAKKVSDDLLQSVLRLCLTRNRTISMSFNE